MKATGWTLPRTRVYPAGMPTDDDPFGLMPRPKPPAHEIGQTLDSLSVHELAERIALLQDEIVRLEAARVAKAAAGNAADAFFRKPASG